ncbi:hypothetical protein HDU86_002604 [Geranomyces michiganensis]|nr:hypothetical protein HDU86_002604 [Geranomyces michiganensis]
MSLTPPFLVPPPPAFPPQVSSFSHPPLVLAQIAAIGSASDNIHWGGPFSGPSSSSLLNNPARAFIQSPTIEIAEHDLLSPLDQTTLLPQHQQQDSLFHSLIPADQYVFPPNALPQPFSTSPTATASPSVTPRGSPVSLPAAAATNRRRKVSHPPNRRHSAVNAAPGIAVAEPTFLNAGKKRKKDAMAKEDPDGDAGPQQVLTCPYPDCTRTFPLTSIKLLVSHLTVHSSLRPFTCEYPQCNKSFARQHDAFRHYRSMHERPSFECPFCKARFSRKDTLKDHMAMAMTRPCPVRANRGIRARSASPAAQPGL